MNEFQKLIDWYVEGGCIDCSTSLGFCKMPEGYALLLNSDHTHYFWLREDGGESCICWDKWSVYRGSKRDSLNYDFSD